MIKVVKLLYQCYHIQFICNLYVNYLIANISISLLVPPSIFGSELPSEMGVLLNESIQLVCRVQGTPTPTIQWLKDGQVIKNAGNKGLRYIKPATRKKEPKLGILP